MPRMSSDVGVTFGVAMENKNSQIELLKLPY
jgi:hypothetical protein